MRIPRLQIAYGFTFNRQILLDIASGLKKLQKKLNGRYIPINVQDIAPPESPRALIRGIDTLVTVAYNRFDIIATPPKHIEGDFIGAVNFARQRSEQVIEHLFEEGIKYEWGGIIVTLAFPNSNDNKNALLNVRPIFDKIINLQRNDRELSSFQLQFGFIEKSINKNYNISGYETHEINLQGQPGQIRAFTIDIKKAPIKETGIQVVLDVNNIPSNEKKDPKYDTKMLIEAIEVMFTNLRKDLNIEGILE